MPPFRLFGCAIQRVACHGCVLGFCWGWAGLTWRGSGHCTVQSTVHCTGPLALINEHSTRGSRHRSPGQARCRQLVPVPMRDRVGSWMVVDVGGGVVPVAALLLVAPGRSGVESARRGGRHWCQWRVEFDETERMNAAVKRWGRSLERRGHRTGWDGMGVTRAQGPRYGCRCSSKQPAT